MEKSPARSPLAERGGVEYVFPVNRDIFSDEYIRPPLVLQGCEVCVSSQEIPTLNIFWTRIFSVMSRSARRWYCRGVDLCF